MPVAGPNASGTEAGSPAKPLRILIVDDEPVARQILREELELQAGVDVVGEAGSGIQTLEHIANLQPDVVLLDLHMPEMGGFEVIQRLRGGPHLPVIIVVTAYDQYAIRALDEGAIDYLLKPVAQARLLRSLDRARNLLHNQTDVAHNLARLQEVAAGPAPARVPKIVGRLGQEYILLGVGEVLAFQAEGEVVWIVTVRQRYVATQSLRRLQEKLQSTSFRRIHRNALVNLDHIRRLAALSSNRWLITLSNGQEFIVSKRMAGSVRQILSG